MLSRYNKIIGYFFLISINIIILCFLLLFLAEFSGFSGYINDSKNINKVNLYETNYYGKKLKKDPYKEFTKQYLHPYYLFSLPHEKIKIEQINSEYISLYNLGFRNAYINSENQKHILLLGGSSAFGHGSSSDNTTIASLVSINSNYNVSNINAPGWNSHQELVALSKYNKNYNISLSYSGSNDLSLYCKLNLYLDIKQFKDLPESYYRLSEYFEDIRGEPIISLTTKIKKFFIFKFPESYRIYRYLKINYFVKSDRLIDKKFGKMPINTSNKFCGGEETIDKLENLF